MCQTLNAELSPKGIHICHIYIDAMIEAPDTLGRLVGEEGLCTASAAKANGKDEMVIPRKLRTLITTSPTSIARPGHLKWTFAHLQNNPGGTIEPYLTLT
ncbi:MAG: hypothetical protein CM15mP21_6250 [Hyphomicrobiales bacterium]|nr:MAG: hypothetical protein CM15mP21_6250 [Hyphomicrobiales bacterium]